MRSLRPSRLLCHLKPHLSFRASLPATHPPLSLLKAHVCAQSVTCAAACTWAAGQGRSGWASRSAGTCGTGGTCWATRTTGSAGTKGDRRQAGASEPTEPARSARPAGSAGPSRPRRRTRPCGRIRRRWAPWHACTGGADGPAATRACPVATESCGRRFATSSLAAATSSDHGASPGSACSCRASAGAMSRIPAGQIRTIFPKLSFLNRSSNRSHCRLCTRTLHTRCRSNSTTKAFHCHSHRYGVRSTMASGFLLLLSAD